MDGINFCNDENKYSRVLLKSRRFLGQLSDYHSLTNNSAPHVRYLCRVPGAQSATRKWPNFIVDCDVEGDNRKHPLFAIATNCVVGCKAEQEQDRCYDNVLTGLFYHISQWQ
jgi:hypothetical protein